ncbi:hypothetical protein [Xanthomonas phage NEB7]|nr:hypothetical protein [Xanthomonas phage NEB7]
MDIVAKAQMYAQEVNAEAGWRVLTVNFEKPNKAGGPLTLAEVSAFGATNVGWFSVQELFLLIRKQSPAKGEAIATGRSLRTAGYPRRQLGRTARFMWLVGAELDSTPQPSAD